MNQEEIARLVEFGEGCAWENFFSTAPDDYRSELGLHVDHLGSAIVLSMPGVEDTFFNRIIGLGLVESVTEGMLDELMSFIHGVGSKYFMVNLSPSAHPPEIQYWLAERGFWTVDYHAKLFRRASPPPETNTTFRIELTGRDFAEAFAYVACQAFGESEIMHSWLASSVGKTGWRHYVAWDGDQPIATGSLFIQDSFAWLGHGSTLPSHRRRGTQSALLARRIKDGLALGCELFVTDTSPDTPQAPNSSYRNIIRAGFQLAYFRQNFIYQSYE
jgi:GNAT superfamily N-acetyltransferase